MASYVPDVGNVVWLDFDPQAGHEQAGHRPAVVLSPVAYNRSTGLMIACPMTTRIKDYPFEVAVNGTPPSVILVDQIKSVDWRARGAVRKGAVSTAVLIEVRSKLSLLLQLL